MRHPTNVGMKNKSFILTAHAIAEHIKQSGIKILALIKSTVYTALSDTDNSEFECMFVQNAVATFIHFGYSHCVCMWHAALLEGTFDDEGL
jgi:hypothetical protein